MYIHGGDIYRNSIDKDYSVSINPLEWPDALRESILSAVSDAGLMQTYPDLLNERLRGVIAKYCHAMPDRIVCGNGASELIMAVCALYSGGKVLLPAPCYTGYERALRAAGITPVYCHLQEKSGFLDFDSIEEILRGGTDFDMLILNNPVNPTGRLIEKGSFKRILELCDEAGITVLVDECFMELSMSESEYMSSYGYVHTGSLIRLRALTKSYRMAGLRLGYVICEDEETADRISMRLPEWNISGVATEAGIACLSYEMCDSRREGRPGYLEKSREYIAFGREWLRSELEAVGIKAYESDVNYIMVYSDLPLYEELLKRGMLIRDCAAIEGLRRGFYRISLKDKNDNYALMCSIKDIVQSV